jgi:hypothetical protein
MSDTVMDVVQLPHNQYAADISALLDARAAKKKLDADSRKQEGIIKTMRSAIVSAMKGSPVARCGNYLIVRKPERRNPGALTLKDGRSVLLSEITEIVVNNGRDVFGPDEVRSWFGGSVIGPDLEINSHWRNRRSAEDGLCPSLGARLPLRGQPWVQRSCTPG